MHTHIHLINSNQSVEPIIAHMQTFVLTSQTEKMDVVILSVCWFLSLSSRLPLLSKAWILFTTISHLFRQLVRLATQLTMKPKVSDTNNSYECNVHLLSRSVSMLREYW